MSKKAAENYLKEPYARILVPEEGGGFSAEILEFPGCFAQGETADKAYRNLEEAAKSWIDTCLEQGLEIPPASANQGYGGKIALRLPRSLHRQAVRMAERDKTSLNQFIVTAVAARVGAVDLYEHLIQRLDQKIKIIDLAGNIALGSFPMSNVAWHSVAAGSVATVAFGPVATYGVAAGSKEPIKIAC